MSQVQPIIGHLLSKYDETAVEGVEKIVALGTGPNGAAFADAFIANKQALEALSAFFQRPSDVSLGFRAVIVLIDAATSGSRAALGRYLSGQTFFSAMRRILTSFNEARVPVVCGCLALMAHMVRHFPQLVLERLRRASPLSWGLFKPLGARTMQVLPYRCAFLAEFALTALAPLNDATVGQHGYLTRLIEDAADIATSKDFDDDATAALALGSAHRVLRDGFVGARGISKAAKRELLLGQRNVLRALARWLACPRDVTDLVATCERLVVELLEDSVDYMAQHDSGAAAVSTVAEAHMVNFALFSLLRLLKPRASTVHTRLTVFILQKAPDLTRPYFARVAPHVFEEDRSVARITHMAAVTSLLCRVAHVPIPHHVADAATAVVAEPGEDSAATTTFFMLTPEALADETCPRGFGEFVHRMINKGENLLHLLLALQATQAVLDRADLILACVRRVFDRMVEEERRGGQAPAVDSYSYFAAVEQHLKDRLPRIEEFWHRLTQQLLASAADAKTQFLLQRLYVLATRYTDVLRLRTPWISAVPMAAAVQKGPVAPDATIADVLGCLDVPLLAFSGATVSSLCGLLISNLRANIQLPKLHHLTLGVTESQTTLDIAKDWPALLSLLLWFEAHRDDEGPEAASAKHAVIQLVLWCVHNVSLRFGASPAEVHLWLRLLTVETAPFLLHLLNSMLQQSLSKAADRVAEALLNSQFGTLHTSAVLYLERLREKEKEKAASEGDKKAPGLWQRALQASLPAVEALVAAVAKKWPKAQVMYGRDVLCPASAARAAHTEALASTRALVLRSRESADADIPTSAHVTRFFLDVHASSHHSPAGPATLPTFALRPSEHAARNETLSALAEPLHADPADATAIAALVKAVKKGDTALLPALLGPHHAHEAFLLMRAILAHQDATACPPPVVALSHAVVATFVEAVAPTFAAVDEVCATTAAALVSTCAAVVFRTPQAAATHFSQAKAIASTVYRGTLSLPDRLWYAAMTMLECAPAGDAPKEVRPASGSLKCLAEVRFCIGGIVPAAQTVPEVDALVQLVDGWSERDLLRMALAAPLRLATVVRLARADAFPNVLRTAFPDVTHVSEYVFHDRLGTALVGTFRGARSAGDDCRLLDPRVILPLAKVVGCVHAQCPGRAHPQWLLRCAPMAIRGLSATDAHLRSEAAVALCVCAQACGGFVRSVLHYIRLLAPQIPGAGPQRVHGPLTSFLVCALRPLSRYRHQLHAAIANCFVTPRDVGGLPEALTHPCPMAHLLTEFPMQCITSEQLYERQLASHRHGVALDSGTTAEATAKITAQLRKEQLPHLRHILDQVRHSVTTKADFEDLVKGHVMSSLLLLVPMLSGVPDTRLVVMDTIRAVVTASREVAEAAVAAPSVRLISWGIAFLATLAEEIAAEAPDAPRKHRHQTLELAAMLATLLSSVVAELPHAVSDLLAMEYNVLLAPVLQSPLAAVPSVSRPLKALAAALVQHQKEGLPQL